MRDGDSFCQGTLDAASNELSEFQFSPKSLGRMRVISKAVLDGWSPAVSF
jgi:hypothetical protein